MAKGYTTLLTNAEFEARRKTGCPVCSQPLVRKTGTYTDDDGKKRFSGTFWGCSAFRLTCQAGYTLGFDVKRGSPSEYQYGVNPNLS